MTTYETVHARVRAAKGSASTHSCAHCGEPARHWSYDHTNGGALIDAKGRKFSTNIDHYKPLCYYCHVSFDLPPDHYLELATVINIDCTHCGAAAGELCRTPAFECDGTVLLKCRLLTEGPGWQHAPRRNRPEVRELIAGKPRRG